MGVYYLDTVQFLDVQLLLGVGNLDGFENEEGEKDQPFFNFAKRVLRVIFK